jgi:hypothetical protein
MLSGTVMTCAFLLVLGLPDARLRSEIDETTARLPRPAHASP